MTLMAVADEGKTARRALDDMLLKPSAPGVRMEARKGRDTQWLDSRQPLPQGTAKNSLTPQGFLGLALAVASATNGSSGQWCLGYRPLRSFFTSA